MAFQYKEQVKYVTPQIDELNEKLKQLDQKNKIKRAFFKKSEALQTTIAAIIIAVDFWMFVFAFSSIGSSGQIHTMHPAGKAILFVLSFLLLLASIVFFRWSIESKKDRPIIENLEKQLIYEKSHLSDKIKVQYDDGEVHFYDDGQYVSDGESCLLVPDGTIYHYYMGCFIHWKPEQQKTVLDKGWLFVDKKRAIEEGFKECKLCAENIKPDKEKYERMLASPEHEVFKLIGASGEECQDNLRLIYNDPEGYVGTMLTCNNVSTTEDKEKWQIYDKYGILRVGSLPKKIIDNYPYYLGRAYIFIKEIIEDEEGFLTAYCYIDMRHHSYKMWKLI